ncbi:MAG: hypothetical protein ACR2KO_06030 [Geodermatophilaceae bacterium]
MTADQVTAKQVAAAAQAATDAKGAAKRAHAAAEAAASELIEVRKRVRTGDPTVQPADLTSAAAAAKFTGLAAAAGAAKARAAAVAHRQLAARYGTERVTAALDPLLSRVDQAQADIAAAVRSLVDARDEYAAGITDVSAEVLSAYHGQIEQDQDEDAPYAWLGGQALAEAITAGDRRYAVDSHDLEQRIGRGVREGVREALASGNFHAQKLADAVQTGQ